MLYPPDVMCNTVQIVLSTQDAYEPGEYSFNFSYRLEDSLPSSFAIYDRYVAGFPAFRAYTAYIAEVSLPVTTSFSADLEASQWFAVYAQPVVYEPRKMFDYSSKTIRVMGIVSRGKCTVSASMDRHVWVTGDVLRVQTSIHNQSVANMSSIAVVLYENLAVTVPSSGSQQASNSICKAKLPGVRAGDHQEMELSLPLVTQQQQFIYPTTSTGTMVNWTYSLKIECKFFLATTVKAVIPVVVLPLSREKKAKKKKATKNAESATPGQAIELDASPTVLEPIS